MSDKLESSTIAETPEDFLSNKFCECLHLLDEEHLLGKCYGLNFNGTVWVACNCTNAKPLTLRIKVEMNEGIVKDTVDKYIGWITEIAHFKMPEKEQKDAGIGDNSSTTIENGIIFKRL